MKHFILLISLFMPLGLMAQNGVNKVFSFLELSNSSRLTALGSNMASIHDNDVSLVLSNPSYICDSMHSALALNYTNYFSDINYGFVTYSHTFEKAGSFAASVQYLNYGNFQETDIYGNALGNFNAYDMALTMGWGRKLHDNFSIGANAKFIYSDLYKAVSSGVAVDVAGSYFNDDKYLSATLVVRNIGRQLNTYFQGVSEPLPFDVQLGVSKRLLHMPLRFSLLAHHLHRWDIRYDNPADAEYDPLTGELIEERKLSAFGDKLMRHFVVGAELAPGKSFSFRIGYNYQRRKELTVDSRLSTVGLSWGFGLRIKKFYFSYARSAYHLAGSPNVITLSTKIDDFLK
ncbi:MAG: type IX secretion system protein PorQ [Bacteroidales bacterium]|nr:type IX secretion system protein PorQ [Bacteroidales bacterium]HPB01865.1 type IX secretion system protein PorQ [Bacteroidales bacterium]